MLRGERHGEEGERLALLVHDEGRDLDAWRGLLGPLRDLGLSALAFDLPGHGASTGSWEPAELVDVLGAVLAHAASDGARSRYLIAAGAAATAAVAVARDREVDAIVALSPLAALPGLPPEALRESTAPKLILAGSEEPARAEQAADLYRRVIGWSVLQTVPVSAQGTQLLESEWAEHVAETVVGFLRDYQ